MGSGHRVIQAAVDYVSGLGSGTDWVCTRGASIKIPLLENSDWYDREVTLTDPSGFEVGDGVAPRRSCR